MRNLSDVVENNKDTDQPEYMLSFFIFIPPANCVCGRVYCFHVVHPSIRPFVRNILFP